MPIFLIGYMGSGKSTIGKCLSKVMNLPFVDLDNLIESEMEMSITQIFNEKGELFFRQKEHDVLSNYPFKLNTLTDAKVLSVISKVRVVDGLNGFGYALLSEKLTGADSVTGINSSELVTSTSSIVNSPEAVKISSLSGLITINIVELPLVL